jgi:DNA-directed RNA polymerase specialized sigma24 family protein
MSELWILIPISAFAAMAWVIHVVVDGFRRRQQLRLTTEFHGKLLDRIGSAHEFGEFLNTSGGARFLDSLLTPRERALLWLAYVEGERHEEIAASLGLGRLSVKVLLFRAKRRLRELLKSRGLARV